MMRRTRKAFVQVILGVVFVGSCAFAQTFRSVDVGIEHRIDSLLRLMTLEEKLGQLNQVTPKWSPNTKETTSAEQREMIRRGRIGSFLGLVGAEETRKAQRVAVEESRLKIPLIFGFDVIHGYRTTFPIPLAMAGTWNPELIEQAARVAAIEASAAGIHWTFAPMVDIARDPRWGRIAEGLLAARLIYFSGITLSLYSNNGLGRFLAILELARKNGVKVAFDGNFRPRGWKGDLSRTRTVFMEALKRVDVALPTYDDEAVLWGDPSPEATVERMQAFGIAEIVVKNGQNSALVAAGGRREFIPVPEVVVPVDTTAAGDSFNAGYLAARLSGQSPAAAVAAAHRLAAEKIQHRGAIMPRADSVMH